VANVRSSVTNLVDQQGIIFIGIGVPDCNLDDPALCVAMPMYRPT
jgi:hypothetical protein